MPFTGILLEIFKVSESITKTSSDLPQAKRISLLSGVNVKCQHLLPLVSTRFIFSKVLPSYTSKELLFLYPPNS